MNPRPRNARRKRQRGRACGEMQECAAVAGSWRFIVLADRQAHRKDRTFALLACHRHVAAHYARELAGDRKAEPRPAVAPCCERIGLVCRPLSSERDLADGYQIAEFGPQFIWAGILTECARRVRSYP